MSKHTKKPTKTRTSMFPRLRDPDGKGWEAAWQDLANKYRGLIYTIAIRLGCYRAEAEEVVQETLAALVERLKKTFNYNPKLRFRNYVGKVARNKAIDKLRTRIPRRMTRPTDAGSETITQIPDPRSSPRTHLEKKERQEALEKFKRAALDITKEQVSKRDYQIFYLAFEGKLSTREICDALGVTPEQVYPAKSRGKRQYDAAQRLLNARYVNSDPVEHLSGEITS